MDYNGNLFQIFQNYKSFQLKTISFLISYMFANIFPTVLLITLKKIPTSYKSTKMGTFLSINTLGMSLLDSNRKALADNQ